MEAGAAGADDADADLGAADAWAVEGGLVFHDLGGVDGVDAGFAEGALDEGDDGVWPLREGDGEGARAGLEGDVGGEEWAKAGCIGAGDGVDEFGGGGAEGLAVGGDEAGGEPDGGGGDEA